MSPYNGPDRRAKSEDHDVLIKLEEMMKNHVENYEYSQIKFNDHLKDDNENFKEISRNQQKTDKILFGGMCVLTVLQVAPHIGEVIRFFTK